MKDGETERVRDGEMERRNEKGGRLFCVYTYVCVNVCANFHELPRPWWRGAQQHFTATRASAQTLYIFDQTTSLSLRAPLGFYVQAYIVIA